MIINDLNPKTPETTSNKPAISESRLQAPQHLNTIHYVCNPESDIHTVPTSINTPLPENETPLIINELSTKTPETTGNKPETQPRSRSLPRSQNPVDPQYAGYPRSSTPPDPTVPYTYYSAKMLITKYPDGRIRYDYGGGRPAITITKGGPAILERRVFYI